MIIVKSYWQIASLHCFFYFLCTLNQSKYLRSSILFRIIPIYWLRFLMALHQAVVTMNNFQMYRHVMTPGWTLGWTWAKKEVIWSMVGAQTTEQGDCSKFKGNIPHCCKKSPTVVDLLPGIPYNQQFQNCCKGGVLASWGQDPTASVSAFQVSVGVAGTSNKTVKLPKNFTLLGPGPGYTCGPAKVVPPTNFLTADLRRKTQALSKSPLVHDSMVYESGLHNAIFLCPKMHSWLM